MTRYESLQNRLAGVALIVGPALVVVAAMLSAAGIGTTTGRWYDNALEGMLMLIGFSLQLIGLLTLARWIGHHRPQLGIVLTATSVLGTTGAILPSALRVFSLAELTLGITVQQLDVVHGATDAANPIEPLILPFILVFFLNYLLLGFGLWRTSIGPRYAPILLVIGTLLFPIGQGAFNVNYPVYVAAVTAWLLALASLGWLLLRAALPAASTDVADPAVL